MRAPIFLIYTHWNNDVHLSKRKSHKIQTNRQSFVNINTQSNKKMEWIMHILWSVGYVLCVFMTLIANYCNCVCKHIFVSSVLDVEVFVLVYVVNGVSPFAAYEYCKLSAHIHTHSSFNQMCTHSGMLVGVQASVSTCALASLESNALFYQRCEPKPLQKFKFKIKCYCFPNVSNLSIYLLNGSITFSLWNRFDCTTV